MDEHVAEAVRNALKVFEDLGATIEEISLPGVVYARLLIPLYSQRKPAPI